VVVGEETPAHSICRITSRRELKTAKSSFRYHWLIYYFRLGVFAIWVIRIQEMLLPTISLSFLFCYRSVDEVRLLTISSASYLYPCLEDLFQSKGQWTSLANPGPDHCASTSRALKCTASPCRVNAFSQSPVSIILHASHALLFPLASLKSLADFSANQTTSIGRCISTEQH
jgi:hypothetical protein